MLLYLMNFGKQKKNSSILNLQIEFITHAKEGVCYCCSLHNMALKQIKKHRQHKNLH